MLDRHHRFEEKRQQLVVPLALTDRAGNVTIVLGQPLEIIDGSILVHVTLLIPVELRVAPDAIKQSDAID